ncbi:Insulin-induced gene 2 protein [Cytospora mali]|uniref:Insulin-induced gene 2 protein n=1 Tax=Cytospora mali TaxID=578113 RepID=A0A194URY7_CYTMA|nr:Insulin-induced gene 2 protein [Valsa mali var. pyri (nom. inval.)]
MSDRTAPPILRPIPRRPFEIGVESPTPPDDDDSAPPSPSSDANQSFLELRRVFNSAHDDSISRATSYKNLTSSTLAGIYSPNISGYPANDAVYGSELPDTPWGTGAETPATAARGSVDEEIYRLLKDRSSLLKRRRSSVLSNRSGQSLPQQPSGQQTTLSLGIRTAVLFVLGMGYGALLSRLSTEQKWAPFPVEGIINSNYNSEYLACWGFFGVVLGSLLPWFDGKWEKVFENEESDVDDEAVPEGEAPGTDWALVVRGVGTFAGIVFAIRKVPWASTMQVSMTLAMVNPFLWYLIDRSKPGFLLSAAVGLAGSVLLMGLNSEVMPTPAGYLSELLNQNYTGQAGAGPLMLGGLATQRTIETGIWVLSVLFCSCVCFGNIGRRLALNKSAAGRGRWGGLR